jgi:hypothetical protein
MLNYTAFLSDFFKLRNETVSVGMSVCSHEATRLPLGGFSLNGIVEDFSKICPEHSSSVKSDNSIGYFT